MDSAGYLINIAPVWIVVCAAVHNFFNVYSHKILAPRYASIDEAKKTIWCNRGTSSFHASIMFISTIIYWSCISSPVGCMYSSKQMAYITTGMMIGYLFYDTCFEVFLSPKTDVMTVIHHVLGSVSFLSSYLYSCDACYPFYMVIYLAEVSTPFLHYAWLMNEMKMTETKIFKYCFLCIMVLFALFRVCLSPALLYMFVVSKDVWNQSVYLYALNGFIIASFMILNFYWFFCLLKLAVKNQKKKKVVGVAGGAAPAAAVADDQPDAIVGTIHEHQE